MKFMQCSASVLLSLAATILLSSAGCGNVDRKVGDQAKAKPDAKTPKVAPKEEGKKELDAKSKHDGWWCQEHGIPEHLCSLCSDEAAAKAKKDGDWCKLHDRAESQCFKCDPSRYKKFEAMYVAKYNKKPEPPPEEEFKK